MGYSIPLQEWYDVLIVPLWNWNDVIFYVLYESGDVLIVPLWNWNNFIWYFFAPTLSSNCTFMELKLGWPRWSSVASPRSNCTFMELKYRWGVHRSRFLQSSNCTFMELKYVQLLVNVRNQAVLIVPLWNWNSLGVSFRCRRWWVLIVPLWNWNNTSPHLSQTIWCSNCTFMELK